MEILNIGPLELIVILIIMFVLLGPKQMIVTAYKIGQFIRSVVKSPMWKEVIGYSMEIRELPKKLMDETGLDDTLAEVKKSTQDATNEIKSSLKEATEAARIPSTDDIRREVLATQAASEQPQAAEPAAAPPVEAQPAERVYTLDDVIAAAQAGSEPPPAPPVGVQAGIPVGVPVGIPVGIPAYPPPAPDLPFEPALRPRRMREPERAVPAAQVASADGAAASFAPRAVRMGRSLSSASTTVTRPDGSNGHNGGSNGNGSHMDAAAPAATSDNLEDITPARTVPPVEQTEPRDAAQ